MACPFDFRLPLFEEKRQTEERDTESLSICLSRPGIYACRDEIG